MVSVYLREKTNKNTYRKVEKKYMLVYNYVNVSMRYTMDKKYKIKGDFVLQKIGSKTMAVPVKNTINDVKGMIALSDSGVLLWKALQEGADIDMLVLVLTDTYEVSKETALVDVENFVNYLKKNNIIDE